MFCEVLWLRYLSTTNLTLICGASVYREYTEYKNSKGRNFNTNVLNWAPGGKKKNNRIITFKVFKNSLEEKSFINNVSNT